MAVAVHCPKCKAPISLDGQAAGSLLVCAGCGQRLKAPAARSSGSSANSAAAVETGKLAGATLNERPSTSEPTKAQRIGRFEIVERLGAGQFGTVYRAFDTVLKRDVALKVPQASLVDDDAAQKRFLREAEAAAQLRHPHIVPVYDAGREGDTFYIASAFIAGATLEKAVEANRPDFRQAADWVRKLAGAVAYAGGQGIVHRDVKPANIMLDQAGEPHLMDFGLARTAEAADKLTHDGSLMGTPAYMSPEQAGANVGPVSPASDQYSLGVVLYELLCGQRPFPEGNVLQVIYQIREKTPPSPRAVNPAIPRDLETICQKAMARQPADRYADCAALAEDLRRWLADEPISARRLGLAERAIRWTRRNPAVAGSTTVAASLLLVISIGALLWGQHSANSAQSLGLAVKAEQAARKAAETNRNAAETNRIAAENALAEVESQRAALERALTDARSAQAAEAAAKEQAVGALDEAMKSSYSHLVTRVSNDLLAGVPCEALLSELTRQTPENLRGWEYRFLSGLGDQQWQPGLVSRMEWPNALTSGLSRNGEWLVLAVTNARFDPPAYQPPPNVSTEAHIKYNEDYSRRNAVAQARYDAEVAADRPNILVVRLATRAVTAKSRIPGRPTSLAIDNQGRTVLAAWNTESENRVLAWSTENAATPWEVKGRLPYHSALSPDGRWVAAPTSDGITIHEAVSGAKHRLLAAAELTTCPLAFDPTGNYVAAAVQTDLLASPESGTVRIWRVATGELVHERAGISGSVCAVDLAPAGRRVVAASITESANRSGFVEVWEGQAEAFKSIARWDSTVFQQSGGIQLHDDRDVVLLAREPAALGAWQLPNSRDLLSWGLPVHSSMNAFGMPDGGDLLIRTVGADTPRGNCAHLQVVKDWRPGADNPAKLIHCGMKSIEQCAISPDGSTVVAVEKQTIAAWDVATGMELWRDSRALQSTGNALAFCRGGTHLVDVNGRTISLRNRSNGQITTDRDLETEIDRVSAKPFAVAGSGQKLLLSELPGNGLLIVDLTTDDLPLTHISSDDLSGQVSMIAADPADDSRAGLLLHDLNGNLHGTFAEIDIPSRSIVARHEFDKPIVLDGLAYFAAGRRIVGESWNFYDWRIDENRITERRVDVKQYPPVFTPDARRIVGYELPGGTNRLSAPVSLKDLDSGRPILTLRPPAGTGHWDDLLVSADGSTIAATTQEGQIVVWRAEEGISESQ